jgi:hypothetical protein
VVDVDDIAPLVDRVERLPGYVQACIWPAAIDSR